MNIHREGSADHLPQGQAPGPAEAQNCAMHHPAIPLVGAWPWVILLLLAILPYIGILRNDFAYAYDDKAQILDNPCVHNFQHLREVLTLPIGNSSAHNPWLPITGPWRQSDSCSATNL